MALTAGAVFAAMSLMELAPQADIDDLIQIDPLTLPAVQAAGTHLEEFEQRVARAPRSANNAYMLATLLMRHARESGDETVLGRAEQLLRGALILRPGYPEATRALPRALNSTHRFLQAADLAGARLAIEPDDASALATMVDSLVGSGKYDKAETTLARIPATGPAVLVRRAHFAELHGRDRQALELLLLAARRARDAYVTRDQMAWYLFRLGDFYRTRGAHETALALANAGLRLQPLHLPASVTRARALVALGDVEAALQQWQRIAVRMPHPEILAALADAYARAGMKSEARSALNAALAAGEAGGVGEDRPMARLLADHDQRPDEALMRARRDLLNRKDLDAWDTLAWSAYRAGHLDEAAEASAEALRYGTRRADYHFHAALIQESLGDLRAARRHLTIALEIDPRFDLQLALPARRALERMRTG